LKFYLNCEEYIYILNITLGPSVDANGRFTCTSIHFLIPMGEYNNALTLNFVFQENKIVMILSLL